jgi:hypothetical protein
MANMSCTMSRQDHLLPAEASQTIAPMQARTSGWQYKAS